MSRIASVVVGLSMLLAAAYGFRNPDRLHFAIDPTDAANNRLIADSVGLHTWAASSTSSRKPTA